MPGCSPADTPCRRRLDLRDRGLLDLHCVRNHQILVSVLGCYLLHQSEEQGILLGRYLVPHKCYQTQCGFVVAPHDLWSTTLGSIPGCTAPTDNAPLLHASATQIHRMVNHSANSSSSTGCETRPHSRTLNGTEFSASFIRGTTHSPLRIPQVRFPAYLVASTRVVATQHQSPMGAPQCFARMIIARILDFSRSFSEVACYMTNLTA